MAEVKIIDIDGVQWEMKDQTARDKITNIETIISSQALEDITLNLNKKFEADLLLARYHYKVGKIHFIDFNIRNIRGENLGTDQTAQVFSTNLRPIKNTSFILVDCIAPATLRCFIDIDGSISFGESKGLIQGNNNIYGGLIFAEP